MAAHAPVYGLEIAHYVGCGQGDLDGWSRRTIHTMHNEATGSTGNMGVAEYTGGHSRLQYRGTIGIYSS
jgi:hypothetical protein